MKQLRLFGALAAMANMAFQHHKPGKHTGSTTRRVRISGSPRKRRAFTKEELIAKNMTNWQNSQWLRNGADPARIEEFAALER